MRTKSFKIEGIYHPLRVMLLPEKKLNKMYAKDGQQLAGFYDSEINTIFVVFEQQPEKMIHTFFHEIEHYRAYETKGIAEEARCDVLGAYSMKLATKTNSHVDDLAEFLEPLKVTTKRKKK